MVHSKMVMCMVGMVGIIFNPAVYEGRRSRIAIHLWKKAPKLSSGPVSAKGTVLGMTDPIMSPVVEVVYIFQMWSGRLEIIPVFALIRAMIWGIDPRIF